MPSVVMRWHTQFLKGWHALLAPLSVIADTEQRLMAERVAQTLAGLFVTNLGVYIVMQPLPTSIIVMTTLLQGMFVILFYLNLRGMTGWVSRLMIGLINLAMFVMWASIQATLGSVILNYLVLTLVLSSRLLPLMEVAALGLMNLLVMVVLDVLSPQLIGLETAIIFNAVMFVAVLMVTVSRLADVERVRESEQRYRNLMDVNYEPIAITNPSGQILNVNTAFETLTGKNTAQLVGMSVADLVAPASRDYLHKHWGQAGTEILRLDALNAQGEEFPIETRARVQMYQGKLALMVLVHNLSYETVMERERREYELRYRAIFENNNDGVYIIDLDGRSISANQRGLNLLGITEDEYKDSTTRDFIVPEQHDQTSDVLQRLAKDESLPVYTRRFRRKNGEIFTAEVSSSLVRDSLNNPLYMQSVVRDITERTRAEESRLALGIQQERNKLLKQLIDDFSHHVRTPLSNIKNSSYLLSRMTDAHKQRHHSEVVNLEIDRLVHLMDDLLTLTRIEPQGEAQTMQPFDLNDLLRDTIPSPVGGGMLDTDHMWQFAPAAQPLILYGSRTRLVDMFKRLFDNARVYTPVGGSIRVQVVPYTGQRAVCVTVADSGIGIAADHLPHIFETFYRTDEARLLMPLSSGLGLSICQKIVELHRGLLTVESELGKGSQFHVWLPTSMTAVLTHDLFDLSPALLTTETLS